jgi:hypothetical protein
VMGLQVYEGGSATIMRLRQRGRVVVVGTASNLVWCVSSGPPRSMQSYPDSVCSRCFFMSA